MQEIKPLAVKISKNTTLHYSGPKLEKGPMPTLFYFALSAQDSLGTDPYNQLVQFLPTTDIRIFSLTLPYHEPPLRPQDALQSWAEDFSNGDDPLSPFFDQVEEAVGFLFAENLVDKEKMALAGLSRGALIAMFTAIRIPSFKHLLFFAPLTDLSQATEYKDLSSHPLVKTYLSKSLASQLYDKHYKIFIGNRDERVSTKSCFELVERLVEEAFNHGIRTPPIELTLYPSIGFKGHGTPPEIFKEGANWLAETLLL